jgi:hypothetical protein
MGLAWLACAATLPAQTAAPPAASQKINPQDIELLRQDIRSQKKQIVAQNLTLSDAEATKFWPIYDRYTDELVKINDKKYSALQQYVEKYGSLSDDQAKALMKQELEVTIAATQLRLKYLDTFSQAIGGAKAATWAQIDNRLSMLIDLQLSSRLPLVQSQSK